MLATVDVTSVFMCVRPLCLRCFIGTPAAYNLSKFAWLIQNSGHFRFKYSFGSMMRRTGTPA
ncbi:MAG: hypothetical protein DMG00_31260 [Acidobacteria bacterium]|nr:MAG: hypothetical protein DMG00_31260 [Acidobacteriota bacterium]